MPCSLAGDLKTRGHVRLKASVAPVLQQARGEMQSKLLSGASISFLLLDKSRVECSRYISAEVWKITTAASLCQRLAKMPYLLHAIFSFFSAPAAVSVLTPCSDANETEAQRELITHPSSSCLESRGQDLHSSRWIPESRSCSLSCRDGDISLRARQWQLGAGLLCQAVLWLPQLERLFFLVPAESTLRWDTTVCQNIELLCTCLRCAGPWLCLESLRRTYIALLNKSQALTLSTASLRCPDLLGGLRVFSSRKKKIIIFFY